MSKNYRRVPNSIRAKINSFNTNNFQVCILRKVTEDALRDVPYSIFGFELLGDDGQFSSSIIPDSVNGIFSKKNIDGYKVVFRDQDKVSKTWYAGERPYFGDWTRGSFSLYITKRVYPSIIVPPQELSINVELLRVDEEADGVFYVLKIYVDSVIDRRSENFESDLFFAINLLQENFGEIDVFETNLTVQEYLSTLIVDWEIFPPGERDNDIQRLIRNRRNVNPQYLQDLSDRYSTLMDLDPIQVISGRCGMRNYFGVRFSERLVVFENLEYGNAIYLLFEDWEELSRLSRTELLRRPETQFYRIKHRFGWQNKLSQIVNGRR